MPPPKVIPTRRPVRPIPPKPVVPPVTQPPMPPGGGGGGVPPAPGPIVIPPWTPPGPAPEPVPPACMPGMWSDGWVLLRQCGGVFIADTSVGARLSWPIAKVYGEETAHEIVNQALGVIGAQARATTTEPWPPARATAKSKGALMADVTLADVLAQLQVLIVNSEQVNTRLAAIEEHLAGVMAEQPPASPAEPVTIWDTLLSETEPPAWVIEPQTSFDAGRAITQAWWGYSPINGTRVVFPPVDEQRRQFLTEIWKAKKISDLSPVQQRFWTLLEKYLTVDAAFYAVLTGLINPFRWAELGARDENEFVEITGKTLEQLWHMSADTRTGGGRVSGDEG